MTAQQQTAITIVKKEPDYWVVYKPSDMSFHSESESLGFVQAMKNAFPADTFYPVHRLDKMTSGLILLATNKESAQIFSTLFEQHQIEKYYLALSKKKPKKKQGSIKGGMQTSRRGSWMLTQAKENWAHTQFFSTSIEAGLRLFLLRPQTGKTHQLRVALKSIGAPILGDERYGDGASDRGYLHAFQLCFEWKGEEKSYQHLPITGTEFQKIRAALLEKEWLAPDKLEWPKS